MAPFLSGLRVLDFSQYIPGPYAALLLGDLGAEVIKVERPGGEAMRGIGPLDSDGISAFYKTLNGGKSIVELDIKSDVGRGDFFTLIGAADVLIESFRPGVLERLGLGPAALCEQHPRLVLCSLSGYGQTGPYRLRAGHDLNYLAFAGALVSTGTEQAPVGPQPPIADYASSLQAVATILAALVGRSVSGRGAHLDVSLAETVLAWQGHALTAAERGGYSFERGVGDESGGAAAYRVYQTADRRFVTLAAMEPRFWRNFCAAVERPDWEGRQGEPIPQTSLIAEVAALFASRSLADWRTLLDPVDCCFEAVLEHAEIADHPQVAARKMLSRDAWPDPLVQTLYPAWIDGNPPAHRKPPEFAEPAQVVERWTTAAADC